jgi:hypothetical protein
LIALGYSGLGDYARDRLGIRESTGRAMARLATALRVRPLLWEAVRSGEVTARKATTILPVAVGEAEALWVERARSWTVRRLAAAVKAERGPGAAVQRDEPWERVGMVLSPEGRADFDEAMALAGRVVGAAAPKWRRLEALCQEFLGEVPVEVDAAEDAEPEAAEDSWLEAAREAMEEETERWSFLERVDPVAVPAGTGLDGETDPLRIDAALRELAQLRDRWDEVLGHLAMLLLNLGLWRDMGFADLGQYCSERLGLSERTLQQRAWLERRLYSFPALREAMRTGRLTYEKARLVAGVATETDVANWIDRAAGTTCIVLRRELEALEDGTGAGAVAAETADSSGARAQMCSNQEVSLRLPASTSRLLDAAFRAARTLTPAWLTPGQCLELISAHFIDLWRDQVRERNTARRRALERDGRLCTVPGCSRAADDSHHVEFRSHGGNDDEANQTGACRPHHLRGVHGGYLRVRGTAPGGLTWFMAAPPL